ncbi:hypothetical protein JQ557_16865 [Bradyrhizobium sp. U87765 SZCCT0131]|uniref:hypothetical protein n=1 Tax=unclassified Bradyrhizobium TaxID=2631580 RepID=UPI001BA8C4D1|nr:MULTISPECIES: hypothetical protein [unclassified Bradyrhizobium]MBR1219681.1 hypothetical protein [Bradyrhizobium sp. U87765 SZCCT0131]MBR1262332.1 hypothetical protein [Bradyrhizobium sp. U87765 SZCCT0134]MBR1308485.1 hypothetical protein [Bradyrhizobium sp. U87765 SZCCT0110]MBR1318114.1 hypothetical protein [Bradyrhizobium sp. U87765 SZCCT0109]MBR1351817.1 hypothetical protein [Bradyrhizobium sp. U87765 SZCCT0048]
MATRTRAYIHIGPVKTGSTYIQKTFYENARVFEKFGISYPYVFPPALDLPRYTNADFMWDHSRNDEAKRKLRRLPKVVISEEGLFFRPWSLRHPALDGLPTKFVLYVRRPADLILSWVAEFAEPYNAVVPSLPNVCGPLSIEEGIEVLSRHYEEGIWRFISFAAGAFGELDVDVRIFDRDSFVDNDLLSDFLHCIGVDAKAVRAHPEFMEVGRLNEAASRKFCDVSYVAWEALGRPADTTSYDLSLIEEITARYDGGDDRSVIETVSDETIDAITQRFKFFENFLSDVFLSGAPVFKNRYPRIYGKPREPYRAIESDKIVALAKEISTRRRGY